MSMGTITRGSAALQEWLRVRGESSSAFAIRAGIDRRVVDRIRSGKTRFPRPDTAHLIEVATAGDVPARLFFVPTGDLHNTAA